jgi:hypothetical protein
VAGRRGGEVIDFGFFLEAFLRVAGAIALDTLAFSIWNIGTRSPATVLRDVRLRLRDRSTLATGALRGAIGFIFVAAGTILLWPAVADPASDFAATEIFAFLVALGLEHLVGPDVRRIG